MAVLCLVAAEDVPHAHGRLQRRESLAAWLESIQPSDVGSTA